jgi:hypothetical protein
VELPKDHLHVDEIKLLTPPVLPWWYPFLRILHSDALPQLERFNLFSLLLHLPMKDVAPDENGASRTGSHTVTHRLSPITSM